MKLMEIESNVFISSKEEFKKFDFEKIDMGMFPSILIEADTTVGTHGAQKYGKWNYRKAKLHDIPRYHSAFMRHYFGYTKDGVKHGYLQGNILDVDSGLNELWQAYWCLGRILESSEKYGYEEVSKEIRGLNND